MILTTLITLIVVNKSKAVVKDMSLLGKIIYLDAGHGGIDSGAIYNNIYEKDINLQITKKLEKELVSYGALVYLTRNNDEDLSETTINRKRNDLYNRAKKINESNCDIYISIHLNSSSSGVWNGTQIFYSDVNKENKKIALEINKIFKENLPNTREIVNNNNYYMYKNINVKGVLIEVGFLSNPNDRYKLINEKYQEKIALYISEGIVTYFTNERKNKLEKK